MSTHDPFQRAVAVIDLGAIERNCRLLVERLAAGSSLCAVVKANAYGHGMIEASEAALRGGARTLAVATATEAFELRERLGQEVPIFLMGALTDAELDVALQARAELACWRAEGLQKIAERAGQLGFVPRVHIKYDTGMGRLGERDGEAVHRLLERAAEDERVVPAGLWTHFATADEEDDAYLREQFERYRAVAEQVRAAHPDVSLHVANSAATLRDPDYHLDMVRCGVAIYGLDPSGIDAARHGLEASMSVHSYVADLKRIGAGESVGYGRSWHAEVDTDVGVAPIGYGDGIRRGLSNRAEILVGGRRRRMVGTISMDNVTFDADGAPAVELGEPAVLLGAQGEDAITAEELARVLGTINYEITCGISPRVLKAHRR